MNDFDALLAELTPLVKAMSAPAGKMAKAEGGEGMEMPPVRDEEGTAMEMPPARADGEGEGGEAKNDEGEGEPEMMGKSFSVTMPDGTVQEAFDGTVVMKALATEITELRGHSTGLLNDLAATKGDLAKSLQVSSTLLGLAKSQAALLKAMQADLAKLGGEGRGRQAVVTLNEKQVGAVPGAGAQPSNETLMSKAMSAFDAGKITATDVARAESHLARGLALPAEIASQL